MIEDKLSKSVLFGGYYGMDNVGDDCFGAISTWGARKYWNTSRVLLLSTKEVKGPIRTNPCLKHKRFFRGQTLCESFWRILQSSCVIWSGGSIFHSEIPAYSTKNISFITSTLGVTPAGAIGVSLGPYKTVADQKAVHRYLRSLKFLTLRDKNSYEEARSISLPFEPVLAADLAMLLPILTADVKFVQPENKILGITVCHYEKYVNKERINETRREKILLNALLDLVQNGFDGVFRFFVFNSNRINGDHDLTIKFYNKIKDRGAKVELVYYSPDPIDIWLSVAECSAMVSTRLHGAIFAAAANVPCILIEYHRKCTDFLNDAGVANKWIIGDALCSSKVFSEKMSQLLNNCPTNFYPEREKLIKMAEKNFTFDGRAVCT